MGGPADGRLSPVRIALAILFLAHGAAHLVGFVVPWKLAALRDQPYTTTLLNGKIDVGDTGIRVVGALWLIGALAFAVLAMAVFAEASWWRDAAIGIAAYSLVLSILGLPGAWIGIVVDALILAYVLFAGRLTALLSGGS
jgi:hypothetical protein